MKSATFMSVPAVLIIACLVASAHADFYVVPSIKKNFAPVVQTGQTDCYWSDSSAPDACTCGSNDFCPSVQDGGLQKGTVWPSPRFADNGDGTVKDNLTGLIWLKNANCFAARSFMNAISDCEDLASGDCGLTDGSVAGDWRLPNIKELQSLIDFGERFPAVTSGHPFSSVPTMENYWSSTSYVGDGNRAFWLYIGSGTVLIDNKVETYNVWPVRDAQ